MQQPRKQDPPDASPMRYSLEQLDAMSEEERTAYILALSHKDYSDLLTKSLVRNLNHPDNPA